MQNDKNKDTFAERLARLDGSTSKPVSGVAVPEKFEKSRQPEPRKKNPVRRIQFWGFSLIALVAGGFYLNHSHPNFVDTKLAEVKQMGSDVKETAYLMAANMGMIPGYEIPMRSMDSHAPKSEPTGVAAKPQKTNSPKPKTQISADPEAYIEQADTGNIIHSPLVMASTGPEIMITDLFSDFEPYPKNTAGPKITQFETMTNCSPKRPAANQKVMGVRLHASPTQANLEIIDDARITSALLKGVKVSVKERLPIRIGRENKLHKNGVVVGKARGIMRSVDVVLTDTSQPIYLVLQSTAGKIVWNLHLAPKVKLAHVVTVTNGKAAVSGLPAKTGLQAMNLKDFAVKSDYGGASSLPSDCRAMPWRLPTPDWGLWKRAERNTITTSKERINTSIERHAAFKQWYKRALGADAAADTVVINSAAHILLGPVPEAKLTYRAVGDQRLNIPKSDHIFTGDRTTRDERITQMHSDLLLSAIGGNIDSLWPAAVTGETK